MFDYLEFRLYKCVNSTSNGNSCAPSANIDWVLDGAAFSLRTISTFVDFNNFTEPIQRFIDEQYYWDMGSKLRIKNDLYLRKSFGIFQDSVLQLFSKVKKFFLTIIKNKLMIDNIDEFSSEVLAVFIRMDAYYDIYDWKVYSFGDLFGQVGGIWQILWILGVGCVYFFVNRLMKADMMG